MFTLTLTVSVYFFAAGMIFSFMLDDIKNRPSSWWPILGAILMSTCWLLLGVWSFICLFSPRARHWYRKFTMTIFDDDSKYVKPVLHD